MKTFKITHGEIIDPSNLLTAAKNASIGKRYREENLVFTAHREEEIEFIRKLFEAGEITFEKLNNTMQSYFGLMAHFTAGNLLRKIIDEFSFRVFHSDDNL